MKGAESEAGRFQAKPRIVWPVKWIKKLKTPDFLRLLNSEVQYYIFPTAEDATQTSAASLGLLLWAYRITWS